MLSIFQLFRVGIGPSSSHTVAPMVAARRFALELEHRGLLDQVDRIRVRLYGSLGNSGRGQGSDRAVLAGLEGHQPTTVAPSVLLEAWTRASEQSGLFLLGRHWVTLSPAHDLRLHHTRTLPGHPNGVAFEARGGGVKVFAQAYHCLPGGQVVLVDDPAERPDALPSAPFAFHDGAQLLQLCLREGLSVADLVLANEQSGVERSGAADPSAGVDGGDPAGARRRVAERVLAVWRGMEASVEAGLETEGVLPGGLRVPRRAPGLLDKLEADESRSGLDWLTCYAMAVNEENAAGGRVVAAPTHGSAGVLPAVLYYLVHRESDGWEPAAVDAAIVRFLLTAAAIGMVVRQLDDAPATGVGCQGEVGAACAMAAAGLVGYREGTPAQVVAAARIAMEHCLGLTCDPVGGLVQIPCIERNGVAACHAVSAARTALHPQQEAGPDQSSGLDEVLETLRLSGFAMRATYRDTSRGGLAVNSSLC